MPLLHSHDSRRWCEVADQHGVLGIARLPVINERPRAIGGPQERSLRSRDEKPRHLGSATVVVSIRQWIGKRYFIDYSGIPDGVAQRSHVLRHSIGTGKTTGRATSVPLRLRRFTQIYSRPLFRVCSRLHSREITLAVSQRSHCLLHNNSQECPRVNTPAPQQGALSMLWTRATQMLAVSVVDLRRVGGEARGLFFLACP